MVGSLVVTGSILTEAPNTLKRPCPMRNESPHQMIVRGKMKKVKIFICNLYTTGVAWDRRIVFVRTKRTSEQRESQRKCSVKHIPRTPARASF